MLTNATLPNREVQNLSLDLWYTIGKGPRLEILAGS